MKKGERRNKKRRKEDIRKEEKKICRIEEMQKG
jgi:hypothetical protein